jgi:hypothetical protein
MAANQNTANSHYTNLLKDGQPDPQKHDVKLIIDEHPNKTWNPGDTRLIDVTKKQRLLESEIGELLDRGYTLAAFNSITDAEATSPTIVALMIKRPTA